MPEAIQQPEHQSPLHRRLVRVGAQLGLVAIGLTFASGALSFEQQPERPLPECWDTISEQIVAAAPEVPADMPPALIEAAGNTPPLPVVDPSTNSAALQVDVRVIRPMRQEHARLGNFQPIQQFEMYGGIDVTVMRDQHLPINEELFNATFERLLTADYEDERIQAHMWCFNNDLQSGRFEGRRLHLRIPAYANVCYSGLRLVVKGEETSCNSSGVTFPNPDFFGVPIRTTDYITASASTLPKHSELIAASRINKSLYHELLWHYYYSLLHDTWAFTPDGIDYDEQYADDHLDEALAQLLEGENPLEQARIVPFANYNSDYSSLVE